MRARARRPDPVHLVARATSRVRCGKTRTRRRRGSRPQAPSRWQGARAPRDPVRPDVLRSRFRRFGRVVVLPWGPRLPVPATPCAACRKQRVIWNDVPAPETRDIGPPRPRRPKIPPRNQPAPSQLTPLGDSLSGRLESGFPGGIVTVLACVFVRCVWSISWPPAPTGKAFCAFRS